MARLNREEIVAATGGQDRGGSGGESFAGYSIDSRTIEPGDLFVAIVGPNHDGHEFVPDAVRKGAAAVLISRPIAAAVPEAVPVFEVADTLRAMQALATHVRSRDRLTVVGITGSAGKTTTKEMAFEIVAGSGPAYRSPGNLNNLFGLPLALLRMPDGTRTAVLEMGMSTPGELLRLGRIARLDVACLTNVMPVHLEFFDSVEAIAAAKAEIFAELDPGATAVWNRDDDRAEAAARRFRGRSVTFGLEAEADWTAGAIRDRGLDGLEFDLCGPSDPVPVHLRAPGRHNLRNALAAAAIADACGVGTETIRAGLERFRPLAGRGTWMSLPDGVRVIDDCYNSNPGAMDQVLAWFSGLETAGRRIVASGDMLELGRRDEDEAHRRLGERIAATGTDLFIGVGPLHAAAVEAARGAGLEASRHFATSDQAAAFLAAEVGAGDLLLVKGSRGMRMEKVIEALESRERCGG